MKQRRFWAFLPAIIWFFFSLFLFTMPGSNMPKVGWLDNLYIDKVAHVGIFCLLTFFLFLPYKKQWKSKSFLFCGFLWAIIAFAYGILIEFVQKNWIPHRSFDNGDIVADMIGCLLPLLIIRSGMLKWFLKSSSIGM